MKRELSRAFRIAKRGAQSTHADFSMRLLLILLVSLLVPVVLGTRYKNDFPLAEQVILGFLIAAAGLLLQTSLTVLRISNSTEDRLELASARSDIEQTLGNIRKNLDDLAVARNLVFREYFMRDLRDLERLTAHAAHKFELPVNQDTDLTEMMLLPFDGQDGSEVASIHYLNDNEFLFDVHARQFFCTVANAVAAGRIRKYRRLMVVSDEAELATPESMRLLAFHCHEPGFECRIIGRDDFEKMVLKDRVGAGKLDIGIYGPWYIYKSLEARADNVSGVFLNDPETVRRHKVFFDRCWGSQFAREVAPKHSQMSLDELFSLRPPPVSIGGRTLKESDS